MWAPTLFLVFKIQKYKNNGCQHAIYSIRDTYSK
jgi:hypothetical protein